MCLFALLIYAPTIISTRARQDHYGCKYKGHTSTLFSTDVSLICTQQFTTTKPWQCKQYQNLNVFMQSGNIIDLIIVTFRVPCCIFALNLKLHSCWKKPTENTSIQLLQDLYPISNIIQVIKGQLYIASLLHFLSHIIIIFKRK